MAINETWPNPHVDPPPPTKRELRLAAIAERNAARQEKRANRGGPRKRKKGERYWINPNRAGLPVPKNIGEKKWERMKAGQGPAIQPFGVWRMPSFTNLD